MEISIACLKVRPENPGCQTFEIKRPGQRASRRLAGRAAVFEHFGLHSSSVDFKFGNDQHVDRGRLSM